MKNCKFCGNKINENDKFCSQCGAKVEDEFIDPALEESSKVIICDICGEENRLDSEECEYCGAGFTGKEKVIKKKSSQKINKTREDRLERTHELKKESHKRRQKKSKQNTKQISSSKRSLDKSKIILLSSVFVLIAAIIIYSGITETKTKSSITPDQNLPGQSRIDLNLLNEINQLENELKNDPQNSTKLLKLANLNHDAGFFEKAINYYKDYLTLKPEDNDAEVDLGVCYFELNKFEEAEKIFENVVKKNPRHQIAYLNLGIVNLNQQEIEKAKEYFKKCIQLGENTDAGQRAKKLLESH